MVKIILATAMCLFGVATSVAQTPTSSPAQTPVAPDELATLSQQWMEAAKQHDTKTLERLMAEDFTLVHPSSDTVTTRAQWLSSLSRIEATRFGYQHLKVVHYGKSLAVVSAVFRTEAVIDGKPWPAPKTACIDVWEKRDGRWQVVTRYAVRPEEITIRAPSAAPK